MLTLINISRLHSRAASLVSLFAPTRSSCVPVVIYETSVAVFEHVKIDAVLKYAQDLDEGYRILVLVRIIKSILQIQ